MVELTPEIATEIVASCQAGADSIATSLANALDGAFAVTIGETVPYQADDPPTGFEGAGLVIMLRFGEFGAVAILPESTEMLPDWYAEPDATGRAKLDTLAQELALLLVPETLIADEFRAERVEVVSTALKDSRVAVGAVQLPLYLTRDGRQQEMTFIWPLAEPEVLLVKTEAVHGEITADEGTPNVDIEPPAQANLATSEASPAIDKHQSQPVPTFAGNVLKVKVPVTVVLASQRTPIREIIELGPGSIVKFEKTCDEPLDLCVGDRRIAAGEVVKVGDKFGLRIGDLTGIESLPS